MKIFINYNIFLNHNIKKISLKLIIIVYLIFIILISNLKKLKICICTIAKNENRYIKEYVDYYKKYGVDKIYLYDNNNLNGERFEEVIKEYIDQNYVEINNWRGIKSPQMMFYNDCYNQNYDKYDWLIFNDIDEYIYLNNFNNIKHFLNEPRFEKCENIQLNWLLFTDNNLIYYTNKSLLERFTEIDPLVKTRHINKHSNGKSILRGHISNIKITNFHCISDKLRTCDGFGRQKYYIQKDYKYYYFKHFFCKSTEEFIEKLRKGDVYKGTNIVKIKKYFSFNKVTYKKIFYIEKEIGVNLKNYKLKLQKDIKKNLLYNLLL